MKRDNNNDEFKFFHIFFWSFSSASFFGTSSHFHIPNAILESHKSHGKLCAVLNCSENADVDNKIEDPINFIHGHTHAPSSLTSIEFICV